MRDLEFEFTFKFFEVDFVAYLVLSNSNFKSMQLRVDSIRFVRKCNFIKQS